MSVRTVYDLGSGRFGIDEPIADATSPHRLAEGLIAASREEGEALSRGLWLNQFTAHFQPVVDLRSGELIGAEALARWRRGAALVPAGDFVRMAERSGLVLGMGERVQRVALAFRAHCGLPRDGGLAVSVNLSGRELFEPSLAPRLQEALETVALTPDVLLCEVPERVISDYPDRAAEAMGALWDVGIACVLDDLSGALSPPLLRSLPLVAAKVDIVAAQRTEETLSSQMRTIDLATSLGITVIGKRVARYADLELLAWLDLSFAQGNAFGEPAPAGVFQGMLVDAGLVPAAVPADRPRDPAVPPLRRNGTTVEPIEAPSSA